MRAVKEHAQRAITELVAVAIRTVQHALAPALVDARNVRQPVLHAEGQQQLARRQPLPVVQRNREALRAIRRCRSHRAFDEGDRWIGKQLVARIGNHLQRRHAVLPEEAVRGRGEAVARRARVDHADLPACARQLHGGGEAGKAAAHDECVIAHVRCPSR
ncbi:hypothetical protein D9M69_612210 [compost metagenome]